MRAPRNEAGFTLIELFIVVLIIGILAAIAVPTFVGQIATTNDSVAKSDLASAKGAMMAYAADHLGTLTSDIDSLRDYGMAWSNGVTDAAITIIADDFCLQATSASGSAFSVWRDSSIAPGAC